jgi:hypothetical protein
MMCVDSLVGQSIETRHDGAESPGFGKGKPGERESGEVEVEAVKTMKLTTTSKLYPPSPRAPNNNSIKARTLLFLKLWNRTNISR